MQSSAYVRKPLLATLALTAAAVATGREVLARRNEADLTGQVALITGGSRGLGLALARELAAEGCRLAICARDAGELDEAARELRAGGTKVLPVTCDVGVEDDVQAMVAQVERHYGQVDLLVTVAGEITVGQFEDQPLENFRRAMDVMFWGTLYPIVAVVPGMQRRNSGRIAAITSIGGKISVPRLLPYSTAKFAAIGLTEGLGAELVTDGIQVTTIIPGLMRTGSHIGARFTGNDEQRRTDYTWFSLGATSLLAPRADRAARIVVRAIKRGETERVFPLPFALVSRLHGLAPTVTIRLLSVIDNLLPSRQAHPDDVSTIPGHQVEEAMDSTVHGLATVLGREAEGAFNQKRSHAAGSPA